MPDEDLNQPNPENPEGKTNPEDGEQQLNQSAQQQIDWEAEDNPYRKRYADSQGQIQPLVRTLTQFAEYDHATKQWKPKVQAQPQQENFDPEKVLEQYDPEFKKALIGLVSPLKSEVAELRRARDEQIRVNEFNSKLAESRKLAISEFGGEFDFAKDGKFNEASPLYKLADEILRNKYAQFNPDGSFHQFITPDAEYLATVEAYAIMAKRSKQPQPNTAKLSAMQGKGTKAAGVKRKLSYEEYSKLSSEQKDAYDLEQAG